MSTQGGIIAVTGGIGSGKSVVCKVLRTKGYTVIDSDALARRIMDNDDEIKRRLAEEIDSSVIVGSNIDRKRLSHIVFSDKASLLKLNSIVHGAVRHHIERLAEIHSDVLFVETAIFFQSGLNRMCQAEWRVTSPLELRVARTMKRSNLTEDEVKARISAQIFEPAADEPCPPLTKLLNDENQLLLPQINDALAGLTAKT